MRAVLTNALFLCLCGASSAVGGCNALLENESRERGNALLGGGGGTAGSGAAGETVGSSGSPDAERSWSGGEGGKLLIGGDSPEGEAAGNANSPAGGTAGGVDSPAGGTAGGVDSPAGGTAGSVDSPAGGTAGSVDSPAGGASGGGEGGTASSLCESPEAECSPGETDIESRTCGPCGLGESTRSRSCTAECVWPVWSDWSDCSSVEVECEPGDQSTPSTVGCGPCDGSGTKQQAVQCTDECVWGAIQDITECSGYGVECCSEVVYCDDPDSSTGTWCRQTSASCSTSEVDRDCAADVGVLCGEWVDDFRMDYL